MMNEPRSPFGSITEADLENLKEKMGNVSSEIDKGFAALGYRRTSAYETPISCLLFSLIALVLSLGIAVWVNWIV